MSVFKNFIPKSINAIAVSVVVLFGASPSVIASPSNAPENAPLINKGETLTDTHKQWLHNRFNDQHQKLIPVVAVADMFYGCNIENAVSKNKQATLVDLIVNTDRNVLAEQLISCLKGQSIKSDIALDYGIVGCFSHQLSTLSYDDKKEKMQQVNASLKALSKEERQKSFTKCVTEQAISYLK